MKKSNTAKHDRPVTIMMTQELYQRIFTCSQKAEYASESFSEVVRRLIERSLKEEE